MENSYFHKPKFFDNNHLVSNSNDHISLNSWQALTPIWPERAILYGATDMFGRDPNFLTLGEFNENVLFRLAFHDCIPYLHGGEEDR